LSSLIVTPLSKLRKVRKSVGNVQHERNFLRLIVVLKW
jgi:hypothetical protein